MIAKACLSGALRKNGEIDEADEYLREAAQGGLREAESRLGGLRRGRDDPPPPRYEET